MLLLILGTAQHRDNDRVVFASRSEMLHLLRYGADQRNLQRLEQALAYWRAVTVGFGKWFFAGSRYRGPVYERHKRPHEPQRMDKDGLRRLPPPLAGFNCDPSGKVALQLATSWVDLLRVGYYVKVPLPLPREAAAQNLVLCILCSFKQYGDYKGISKPRRQRRLCRALGLNHSRRNQVFANAVASAELWFAQNYGKLMVQQGHGKVAFITPQQFTRKHNIARRQRAEDKAVSTTTPAPPIQKRQRAPEQVWLQQSEQGRNGNGTYVNPISQLQERLQMRLALAEVWRTNPDSINSFEWRGAMQRAGIPLPPAGMSAAEYYDYDGMDRSKPKQLRKRGRNASEPRRDARRWVT